MAANETIDHDKETGPNRRWMRFGLASLLVVLVGLIADFFGPMDLGDVFPSDAVAYLDCARAFGRGDWHAALNPLWSPEYPALLAVLRPAFAAGVDGVWWAAHILNLLIFAASWIAFCWFARELIGDRVHLAIAACAFLTAEVCVDQVSRIGPDKLAAPCLYLACALLLRLARKPVMQDTVLLGLVLGFGYLAKVPLLPVGCVALLAVAWQLSGTQQRVRVVLIPAAILGMIVVSYGTALSRATGWRTLGESGSINYAWHVNRLEKWVHWQGGVLDVRDAWDSARLARFARWTEDPPDFGRPEHPTRAVGGAPTVYLFLGGRHATYDPYYDPPYWYRGYRHTFNWRYQVIALVTNCWHLVHAVAVQPFFWAIGLVAAWFLRQKEKRLRLREARPVVVVAMAAIFIYLPVHLEDRYIGGALAVLAMTLVRDWWGARGEQRAAGVVLVTALIVGLAMNQRTALANLLHERTYRDNAKWKLGLALQGAGLGEGAQVGVVSSGPSYDSDWAYIGQVEIVAEIATVRDESAFVNLSDAGHAVVMEQFRGGGAKAVLTRDEVVGKLAGWQRVGDVPLWIYRLR